MDDEILRTHEAADLLRVHRITLLRWRKEGHGPLAINVALPGERPSWRYLRADIEAWIQRQRGQHDRG